MRKEDVEEAYECKAETAAIWLFEIAITKHTGKQIRKWFILNQSTMRIKAHQNASLSCHSLASTLAYPQKYIFYESV